MRLIDADALLDSAEIIDFLDGNENIIGYAVSDNVIKAAPTISVKQMAYMIARHCKETTECTDCEFFTGNYERMCMLSDDEFCEIPSDWLLLKDGDLGEDP